MQTDNLIPYIILAGVFIVFIYLFFDGIYLIIKYFTGNLPEKTKRFYSNIKIPENADEIRKIIEDKFEYYRKLSGEQKIFFLQRLIRFIRWRKFIPVDMSEVTTEMKVLISASAVQLTFGLDKYIFPHFKTIYVFPGTYLSGRTGTNNKGEVAIKGTISFSYKDFLHGYAVKDDSINVGLHEMAHALNMELMLKDEYDYFFATYYPKWISYAKPEFIKIHSGSESFLREYAGRNMQEFFAVCIENFFERTAAFKERLPEIYKHLSLLLNQDPSNQADPLESRQKLFKSRPFDDTFSVPGYVSPWPYFKIVSGLVLLCFFAFVTYMSSLYFLLLIIIPLFIRSIRCYSFQVYSKHLIVVPFPPMRNRKIVIDYNTIISIKYCMGRSNFIRVTYYPEDELKVRDYNIDLSKTELQSLFPILYKKSVALIGAKEFISEY